MTTQVLILGKGGQLSNALAALLPDALVAGQDEADFLAVDFTLQLDAWLGGRNVSAVINAAAYTAVDKAEGEGSDAARRINGSAVEELAHWCKKRDVPLVHFSTDYVFDGSGDAPRAEDAPTGPLNSYGISKLEGENAVIAGGGHYLIFRTSWVYDATGKNFFNTILRLLEEKESLNVIDDQVGAPTYALHLAAASIKALEAALGMEIFPSGLYHLCNAGATSWCGFAQGIFALATGRNSGQGSAIKCKKINPIPTEAYPLPAPRPRNSRLDCTKAAKVLGVTMPMWDEGLKECFKARYEGS